MSLHHVNFSFNGGEITPYLAHVNNLDKHATSAARMENFIPMPFGSIRKRPGTLHLATLPREARLESFTFSDGISYVMAFLPSVPAAGSTPAVYGSLRIYRADAPPGAEPVRIFTEDTDADANFKEPFRLQFSQINDVIDIVDPHHHPRQLTSRLNDLGVLEWDLKRAEFRHPPLLDENTVESHQLSITSGVAALVPGPLPTTTHVLNSTAALFNTGHVGAVFQISHKRDAADFERSLKAQPGTGAHTENDALDADGIAYFSTSGGSNSSWSGTFTVRRSDDNGVTWYDFRKYHAEADRHVPVTEIELDAPCLLALRYTGSNTPAARGILAVGSPFTHGLVQVTAYTSPTAVEVKVLTRVRTKLTEHWSEGAFSEYRGYPRSIAVHDRRRVYAGTHHRPMSLWLSRTDALDDFQTGTEADAGMYRTLAATRQSPILWLASQRRLFVGTNTSEWVVGSENDEPISPLNFVAREYTRFGSNTVPAANVNDSIYFVERQGLRLREFTYTLERDTFEAPDLTRLAEHMTTDGITQMAFQQSREPALWLTTGGGSLLSFAYNRAENLSAWARHPTHSGKFRSVTVVRNNRDDDDVFFLVERTTDPLTDMPAPGGHANPDGTWRYYTLEKFSPSQQAKLEAADLDGMHYADGGDAELIGRMLDPQEFFNPAIPFPARQQPVGTSAVTETVANDEEHTGLFVQRVLADHATEPYLRILAQPYLKGKTVHLLVNGMFRTAVVAEQDEGPMVIKLPSPPEGVITQVSYGLPISSVLETLPLDIQADNGSTHSRLKRAHELKLNVLNTFGGSYTYDGTTEIIHYTSTADLMDQAPALRTGWISHTLPPAHLADLSYSLRHDEPYPFLLRASILSWSLHEP